MAAKLSAVNVALYVGMYGVLPTLFLFSACVCVCVCYGVDVLFSISDQLHALSALIILCAQVQFVCLIVVNNNITIL